MLKLTNIRKSYTTGDFTQVALNDVSVAFRDSEFVAILGPSGSGKTTLLNIVGGLDTYDSGDLVIDGVSTKEYKDRDWDTYRNNRCGFVFQSYNLIPHQTILQNVELALTLSGVGREERTERARAALEEVGLGEHVNKRPNQLSGGQMQRVAIARALINDPDILLADEPTGALDSKTSVQIMDLLTQIARNRLVVMVTHNPELAEKYATRIVNLADGEIRSDTDPFNPTDDEMRLSEKPVRRTRMGFLTALGLSFNNLMTKKGRTIMTAFAGSIGIIGIAAILALANGVNDYIETVEEETLTSYPLQITSQGFDITSMMVSSMDAMHSAADSGNGGIDAQQASEEDTVVREANIMNRMFDSIGSNDLASLKSYFDSGESDIDEYASHIAYQYNVTPQIYLADTADGVEQVNPDTTFSAMGFGSGASTNIAMSSMMSTDIFAELRGTIDMAKETYDLKAGHWPEEYNECVLVLTESGSVQDFMLYVLGLRDRDVMDEMVRQFINGDEVVAEVDDDAVFTYKDFLDLKLKLVCSADFYQYDGEYNVWVDKSNDEGYMKAKIAEGDDIVISGIIQAKDGSNASMMSSGIFYTPKLTRHLIEESSETDIVKQQLTQPAIDVFNGKSFADEAEDDGSDFDMSTMFTVDDGAIQAAFKFDTSSLQLDLSGLNIDMSQISMPDAPNMDMSAMQSAMQPTIDQAQAAAMARALMSLYVQQSQQWGNDIEGFLSSADAQALIAQYMPSMFKVDESAMAAAQASMQQQMQAYMTSAIGAVTQQMQGIMQRAMTQAMSQLSSNMASAMNIDADAFANAFQFNMSEDELSDLIMSMMGNTEATYDGNLAKLDYADLEKPSEIDIFAKDFEAKQGVIDILDAYNARMNEAGDEGKVITYTDIVGALMSSVTTIIDMISYVLIAFVSISLIVSSIMIGVITYISVLERKKEIGILRAIGASKGDISRVFNAETIIEGLIAGILGVGITALVCIPVSAIIYAMFDVPNVAQLPPVAGLILIAISVFLTFIAGLIPASSASRKDPVEALRSE